MFDPVGTLVIHELHSLRFPKPQTSIKNWQSVFTGCVECDGAISHSVIVSVYHYIAAE